MSIKKLFLIIFGIQFVLVAGLGVLIILFFNNADKLNHSWDNQYQSYLLADELRQSSDDLTRLARTYAFTGKPEYESEYLTILDIRTGKAPRPEDYNRIYWDFVAATGKKPRPDGEKAALLDLMEKTGFTQPELAKLAEAQKNSENLVKAETSAMNAVKGLYADDSGNFTLKKTPDREAALTLLFDEAYHQNKARVMQPIDDFYVMLETRTAQDVAQFEQRSTIYLWSILILILIIILITGLSLLLILRQVVDKLRLVVEASKKLAEQDLTAFTNEIGEVAQGDLTRKVWIKTRKLNLNSNNEVGQVAQALDGIIGNIYQVSNTFQKLVGNFHDVLLEVKKNADEVGLASARLVETAGQTGEAATQISITIQQVTRGIIQETEAITRTAKSVEQMSQAIDGVAKGAQEQAASVGRASQITSGINQTIAQVAGNALSVTQDSADAAEAARQGTRTMTETVGGMQRIREKVSLSARAVAEMGARSTEIEAIVEKIQEISSQTNLLALNAAIEAARAGTHGKGFAVVADEVRKLAERASHSTKEIGGLIKSIQGTVNQAVSAMEEGGLEVENGVRLANESGQALAAILKGSEAVYRQADEAGKGAAKMSQASNQLVSAVEGVSVVVEQNTAATRELAAGTAEVSRAIENIAAVSEQSSASMEEVSASTEEISAQVEEVAEAARMLAGMARGLQKTVSRFNLGPAV